MRFCRPLFARPFRRFSALLRDSRGASTIEYGLILAFIVLMMFGALTQMAGTTRNMWNDVSNQVTNAR